MNKWLRCLLFFFVLAGVLLGGSSYTRAAQDSWAVYIYMCGSDLESESGFATANLNALKSVPLPENVKFVIQTGGARTWHTDGIPAKELGRYVYDSAGFHEAAASETIHFVIQNGEMTAVK